MQIDGQASILLSDLFLGVSVEQKQYRMTTYVTPCQSMQYAKLGGLLLLLTIRAGSQRPPFPPSLSLSFLAILLFAVPPQRGTLKLSLFLAPNGQDPSLSF